MRIILHLPDGSRESMDLDDQLSTALQQHAAANGLTIEQEIIAALKERYERQQKRES